MHLRGGHRLWVLNATAATLWCLLDGARPLTEVVAAYSRRFGLGQSLAARDVATTLERLEAAGLLAGDDGDGGAAIRACPPEDGGPGLAAGPGPASDNRPQAPGCRCRPAGLGDEGLVREWSRVAARLGPGAPASAVELTMVGPPSAPPAWDVFLEGVCLARRAAFEDVVPLLVNAVFTKACDRLAHRLLIHAAVLARGGRALVLPAPAGAGKSTLAAALAARGWVYLSDELAVVDAATLRVEPFPLPIGLKDGALAPLARYWPEAAALPRHRRQDGRGVRYLAPRRWHAGEGLPVAALVFPAYRSGGTGRLEPMTPLEALAGLAASGSSARPLVPTDIEALLALARRPCRRLDVDYLSQAVEQLAAWPP